MPEEGSGEGVFGAVADGVGDVGHALVGVTEAAGGDVEAPTGEVLQRRPADELGEPAGEAGPRQADRRSELGHRPGVGRFGVHPADGAGHEGIAQGGQPGAPLGFAAVEPGPQDVDEEGAG